jgi:thiol-disulfide isomerase/thioredoxin
MKYLLFLFFLISFAISSTAQDIPVFTKFEDFEKEILNIQDDKVYVINFWATWCGPCVKELPYFEELGNEYEGKKVITLLVSIDWETNLEKKLIPFIEKKGLKKKVILFDDPKANNWIDKIDSSWSGAIPITLVMSKDGGKDFYEKEYHSKEEIEKDIIKFINK